MKNQPLHLQPLKAILANQKTVRGVAQPGSVSVWGAGGRKFKSCHPDEMTIKELNTNLTPSFLSMGTT